MGRITRLQNEVAQLQSVLAQRNTTIAEQNRKASADTAERDKLRKDLADARSQLAEVTSAS